ncbi:MAG: glycerol-3-phosphate responsive antiterminator [Erysipelothrix sp.]|jgi:glycerol uptake operon antiterminator|nr:glycerol-3-phosphate responsive antiterminator [Erysipelothrix sp.]
MFNLIQRQICIPVIPTMKRLEQFLMTDLSTCLLQDIHVSLLADIINTLHKHERKTLVHIDMINGVSSDEYGTEYVCQKLKADGVISSKSKIIETTKRNKKIAIQRMFLIDSKSVDRGVDMLLRSKPDMVEVMPAIAYRIIPYIKDRLNIPIIGGGLLKTKADIENGLKAGCVAFTVSDLNLCKEVCKSTRTL